MTPSAPRAKQIYAIGGGGFSMEPDNLALDRELLALSGKPRPKVCFVSTASFDSPDYIERFYRAFRSLPCEPTHLTVKIPNVASVKDHVLTQDILYVGGGDALNLLDQWHKTRFDLVIKEAYESGIVLAGVGAGAFCWFEAGMTDSTPGQFAPVKGLGLLEGSLCVHYDSEIERKVAYQRFMLRGLIAPGLALDDGVALHYVDGALRRAVSSRAAAQAHRVEVRRNTVLAQPLAPALLE